MIKKIIAFMKKYWAWILLIIAGILVAIFHNALYGLFFAIVGGLGGGSKKAIEVQQNKIAISKTNIEAIKRKNKELTLSERKKLKELENAKKNVDSFVIDDLVDWGNRRGRYIRRKK